MGLDTTHDCWHGAYSSFGEWRRVLCQAAGLGNLYNYQGFFGSFVGEADPHVKESQPWPSEEDEPLVILLHHSDCDGEIRVDQLRPLRERLEQLLPSLDGSGDPTQWTPAGRCQQFIDGLKDAEALEEPVKFH